MGGGREKRYRDPCERETTPPSPPSEGKSICQPQVHAAQVAIPWSLLAITNCSTSENSDTFPDYRMKIRCIYMVITHMATLRDKDLWRHGVIPKSLWNAFFPPHFPTAGGGLQFKDHGRLSTIKTNHNDDFVICKQIVQANITLFSLRTVTTLG